jgi:hypothetical protein
MHAQPVDLTLSSIERTRETALMKRLLQGTIDYGPYILLVLLPGGSVIAQLLWLFRHHYRKGELDVQTSESHCAGRAHAHVGVDEGARLWAGPRP